MTYLADRKKKKKEEGAGGNGLQALGEWGTMMCGEGNKKNPGQVVDVGMRRHKELQQ